MNQDEGQEVGTLSEEEQKGSNSPPNYLLSISHEE